jgi:hypothetical protein
MIIFSDKNTDIIMPEISSNRSHKKTNHLKQTFFQKYGSLLLSHHPDCEKFKNHTIKIGSKKFCIGCFIGYPTAIIGILLFNILKIYLLFDSITLFVSGIILLSFFLLSPLNLTKRKGIKIFQKFCIGLGSVFLFWWIWTISADIIFNLLSFILIFSVLIVILNGYHAYSFLKTCKKCKYKTDWHNCPGFYKIYKMN